jgi:hypothetical protein
MIIKETKIIKTPYYEYKYKNARFAFIGIQEYININIKYIDDILNDEYIYLITVKFKDCEFSFKIKEESIFEPCFDLEKIRDIIETDKKLNTEIHEIIFLSLEDYFNVKYADFTKDNYINFQGSMKITTVDNPNKKELKIKSKSSLNIDFKRPEFILLNELYYHLKLIIAIKKTK